MTGIIFLAAIIGVIMVVVWCIRNDKVPDGKPTTGLFAMKEEYPIEEDETAAKRKPTSRFGINQSGENGGFREY